jgi:hypothetical protein
MNGIKRQLTIAYTPQQNGVAERKNSTMVEMARSVLQTKGLRNSFWGDVVATSVYILNRCPTSALDIMTPYEAWYEKKPNVNHFRVFGCVAYVHVVDQKRQKLDPKSELCIFVGYSEQSKAYMLYNPLSNRIVVSRDIIFYEGGVYGHKKFHDDMFKSILDKDIIDDIDNEQPTNISVPSATNPPISPSSNSSVPSTSPTSSANSTRKVRRLSDIYQRSKSPTHEENQIGETVNFSLLSKADFEPSCFKDACTNEVWLQAMQEEIYSIHMNDTWELTKTPHDKKKIGTKWVYKTKYNSDGSVERHKERLVAKGLTQRYGIDYQETFAPVARQETVRVMISLAAQKKWNIHHMDVKSAFLNGCLEEEVFVEQPQVFEVQGKEHKVYKLKKALYGLK